MDLAGNGLAAFPDKGAMPSGEAPLQERLARLERRFPQTVVALPSGAHAAVRQAGAREAPAVVLLHGIGSGAASWFGVAEALAGRTRVIAWEAPGYGASSAVGGRANLYPARLAELLAALDVESCVLAGHSLGALIATAFACGPDAAKVRRLVLLDPARGYGAPDRAAERRQVHTRRLAQLEARGIAGIADDAPGRMLSASASAEARAWVHWNASRLNPAGYADAVELLCEADIAAAAGCLTAPCDVHCGEHDAITPPDACRAIAHLLGASFALISAAGHASPVEQPDAVARLLRTAMEAKPRARRAASKANTAAARSTKVLQ